MNKQILKELLKNKGVNPAIIENDAALDLINEDLYGVIKQYANNIPGLMELIMRGYNQYENCTPTLEQLNAIETALNTAPVKNNTLNSSNSAISYDVLTFSESGDVYYESVTKDHPRFNDIEYSQKILVNEKGHVIVQSIENNKKFERDLSQIQTLENDDPEPGE